MPRIPPYACIFCGAPSWVDPSDQTRPPAYCHEADHGSPDEDDLDWSKPPCAERGAITPQEAETKCN